MSARSLPTAVALDVTIIAISAGLQHTCAVSNAGDVYCWGANERGQVGDGVRAGLAVPPTGPNPYLIDAPHRLEGVGRFESVDASLGRHTCAISSEGRALCWGSNDRGELGLGVRRLAVGVEHSVQFSMSSTAVPLLDP